MLRNWSYRDGGMSKRFRYDDSAQLEKKDLLSDCSELDPGKDGERSDTAELTSTINAAGSSSAAINSYKAARSRVSSSRPPISPDIETSDFGGTVPIDDELLRNDVGMPRATGTRDTEAIDDHEKLTDNHETVADQSVKVQSGSEIGEDGIVTEYEVALKYLGFGLFHVFLMIVNGIAFCADTVEILSLAFVLPLLNKPDEFGISDSEGAILSSVIFIGMLFGSYIWGTVADVTGRRTTMLMSLTCTGVFGLASAFAPSYWLFTLMRFFSGFGVGGSLPVLLSYNSEFVRNKYRGPFLSLQGLFWMFGRFMCGGLAWILIPMTSIQPSFGSFQFHSWRIFLALLALPSILGALLYLVMPETPRYLLEAGKEGKALKILQMVYKINHFHKKDAPEYPVKGIHLDVDVRGIAWFRHSDGRWSNLISKITEIIKRTSELYYRKFLKTSLLLMVIMFSLAFSAYGMMLWFPTYVSEITTEQKEATFNANCQQIVSHFNAETLQSYCSCKNTTFRDTLISGTRIESWMISDVIFSNVTFRNVTFDNVVINGALFANNCAFHNCTVKNSQFMRITWTNVFYISLYVSSSNLCDLRGLNESDILTVKNTTINGITYNQTTIINGSIFDDNSTSMCRNQVSTSGVNCNQSSDISTVYQDSFIIAAATLPGYVVSAVAVYLFRRNYWLAFTIFLLTVSVFLLYVAHSEEFVVLILCLFTALSIPAWSDACLIIAEVYPTHLRATAAGVHLLMARFGAIIGTNIFGAFVRVNPSIPILTVASVLLVSVLAAIPLPKTTRKTLLK